MSPFEHLKQRALIAAIIASLVSVVAAFWFPDAFFQAWLFAEVFCVEIALGALAVLMLLDLTGGRWGALVRRPLAAAAMTLPVLGLLFVPLLLGLGVLYPWARPGAEAIPAVAWGYLGVVPWVARTVVYFVVWSLLARAVALDETPSRRGRRAGWGLVVYVLTATFAAVDWTMSLDPRWTSTAYGLIVIAGQFMVAIAFAVVVAASASDRSRLALVASPDRYNDLGNMLLASVMSWAYVAFSQYLIVWSGNLPKEIGYYARRREGFWAVATGALMLVHFFAPFLLLLSRQWKRREGAIALIAAGLIAAHALEVYWRIVPAFNRPEALRHWLDLVVPFAVGGWWLLAWGHEAAKRPLVPDQDLTEVPAHGA